MSVPSLYDMTVPMFIHVLKNLDACMTKAEAHAQANNVSLKTYMAASLYPDMADFTFQVQAAGDFAMYAVIEVGGIDVPKPPFTGTTFAELHQRIAQRIDKFSRVKREDLDGKHDKEVYCRGHKWTGLTWCTTYCIPNFYFHVVTAYDILRHVGVPLGKANFLGLPEDFYELPWKKSEVEQSVRDQDGK